MSSRRRALRVAVALGMLSLSVSCALVVDPEAGGAHCRIGAAESDCSRCLASRCQAAADACCFPGTCNEVLTVLERCASAHDSACNDARARTTSADAAEARLAACAATRCASVCAERSGTSRTQCTESRSGEAACTCTVAEPANDVGCSEVVFPGALCCATKGWPGPGLGCGCAPYVCNPTATGCFCSINEYATPGFQSSCSGAGLSCCTDGKGSCRCGTAPCEAPEIAVAECSRAVAICNPATEEHVESCAVRTP